MSALVAETLANAAAAWRRGLADSAMAQLYKAQAGEYPANAAATRAEQMANAFSTRAQVPSTIQLREAQAGLTGAQGLNVSARTPAEVAQLESQAFLQRQQGSIGVPAEAAAQQGQGMLSSAEAAVAPSIVGLRQAQESAARGHGVLFGAEAGEAGAKGTAALGAAAASVANARAMGATDEQIDQIFGPGTAAASAPGGPGTTAPGNTSGVYGSPDQELLLTGGMYGAQQPYAKGTSDAKKGQDDRGGPTDVVPAMLSPGEAVLNRGAAEHIGRATIKALNDIGLAKMSAQGGMDAPQNNPKNQPQANRTVPKDKEKAGSEGRRANSASAADQKSKTTVPRAGSRAPDSQQAAQPQKMKSKKSAKGMPGFAEGDSNVSGVYSAQDYNTPNVRTRLLQAAPQASPGLSQPAALGAFLLPGGGYNRNLPPSIVGLRQAQEGAFSARGGLYGAGAPAPASFQPIPRFTAVTGPGNTEPPMAAYGDWRAPGRTGSFVEPGGGNFAYARGIAKVPGFAEGDAEIVQGQQQANGTPGQPIGLGGGILDTAAGFMPSRSSPFIYTPTAADAARAPAGAVTGPIPAPSGYGVGASAFGLHPFVPQGPSLPGTSFPGFQWQHAPSFAMGVEEVFPSLTEGAVGGGMPRYAKGTTRVKAGKGTKSLAAVPSPTARQATLPAMPAMPITSIPQPSYPGRSFL